MSEKINLYLHGEMEALANHLSGDNATAVPVDTDDLQALLANICTRVAKLEHLQMLDFK